MEGWLAFSVGSTSHPPTLQRLDLYQLLLERWREGDNFRPKKRPIPPLWEAGQEYFRGEAYEGGWLWEEKQKLKGGGADK